MATPLGVTAARQSSRWTRESNGSDSEAGAVGSRLGLVPDVAWLAKHAPPARELQQDPVRVLEVERPDKYAGVQFSSHAQLTVVVVQDRANAYALGLELRAVFKEALFRHVERDVFHRAHGACPLAETGHRDRC